MTQGQADWVTGDPVQAIAAPSTRRVIIEGRGFGAEGFTRTEQGFISVPHTHPGDEVEVIVGEFRRGRAWAHVARTLSKSALHVDPSCHHYDRCSGCAMRHFAPDLESDFKLQKLRDIWTRCGPESTQTIPIDLVSTGVRSGHRTRGRMSVFVTPERVSIGLRSLELDGKVVDVRDCPAQSEQWRALMGWIGDWLDANPEQAREVDQVDLRVDGLARVVTVDEPWTHPNPEAAKLLVSWTMQALDGYKDTVLDLCCGTGTITRALATQFTKVISVDEDRRATSHIQKLGLDKVEVCTGRLGVILRKLRRQAVRAGCAVINPMRRPLGRKQLKDLEGFGLHRIVYLGPSPLSAAKDALILQDMGFMPLRAAAIDLHPGTAQVMMGIVYEDTLSNRTTDI